MVPLSGRTPVSCVLDSIYLAIYTSMVIWHLLHGVSVLADVHDGHSSYLPQSSLQISITRGHNVTLVLGEDRERGE